MQRVQPQQFVTILAWLAVAAFSTVVLSGQSPSTLPPVPGDLAESIAAMVSEPAVSRAHWGVMVNAMDGSPIFSLNESQFFQPASNAKLFTTAAALALIPQMTVETRLVGRGIFTETTSLHGDLILIGEGDANLSARAIPYAAATTQSPPVAPLHFLEAMADAVARSGLKTVDGNIVGDDTYFPWEPYAVDWAIDDAVWGYGAPVSALTINDNQIKVTVRPGQQVGSPALVTFDPAISYYDLDKLNLTTGEAKGTTRVEVERTLGSRRLRLYGSIALDAAPYQEEIAILDPAEYAALALKEMLQQRGIAVTGIARAEHEQLLNTQDFLAAVAEPVPALATWGNTQLGRPAAVGLGPCMGCPLQPLYKERSFYAIVSPTVAEDVVLTNKDSQNLHAELLLRQLGAAAGPTKFAGYRPGAVSQGARVVRQFLVNAGIDPGDFVFYDGSGLSGHDLVTPRAITKLLQFAAAQPWFATYKSSLPVGGIDGSLLSRFTKSPLKGHVFAKTGTLGEARALSGYLECASGRTVIFSILSGNHAPGSHADREVMDRIVAAVAAAN